MGVWLLIVVAIHIVAASPSPPHTISLEFNADSGVGWGVGTHELEFSVVRTAPVWSPRYRHYFVSPDSQLSDQASALHSCQSFAGSVTAAPNPPAAATSAVESNSAVLTICPDAASGSHAMYAAFAFGGSFYTLHPSAFDHNTELESRDSPSPHASASAHSITRLRASFLAPSALSTLPAHTLTRTRASDSILAALSADGASTCGVDHSHPHAPAFGSAAPNLFTPSAMRAATNAARSDRSSFPSNPSSRPRFHAQSGSVPGTVELLIVNDHKRYQTYRQQTEILTANIVAAANELYKVSALTLPGLELSLVAQLTFNTADPYDMESCGGCSPNQVSSSELLTTFNHWRGNATATTHAEFIFYDAAHLFSGYQFDGTIFGLAVLNGICRSYNDPPSNGGIESATISDSFTANLLAHELGHNLGMTHVGVPPNACGSDSLDVMSAQTCLNCNQPRHWSACSQAAITATLQSPGGVCLQNTTQTSWTQKPSVCGNGFVETSETCDCGSADCSTLDPCCNGATCQLHSGNQCGNGDECCNAATCQFHASGHVCRAAINSCDIPEQCTGASSFCPADLYVGSGSPCGVGFDTDTASTVPAGLCYGGVCASFAAQCGERNYSVCTNKEIVPCSRLYCSIKGQDPTSCYSFSVDGFDELPYDGVSCGANGPTDQKQCFSGKCVNSISINANQWNQSLYVECDSECNSPSEYVNFLCSAPSRNTLPDAACTPPNPSFPCQVCPLPPGFFYIILYVGVAFAGVIILASIWWFCKKKQTDEFCPHVPCLCCLDKQARCLRCPNRCNCQCIPCIYRPYIGPNGAPAARSPRPTDIPRVGGGDDLPPGAFVANTSHGPIPNANRAIVVMVDGAPVLIPPDRPDRTSYAAAVAAADRADDQPSQRQQSSVHAALPQVIALPPSGPGVSSVSAGAGGASASVPVSESPSPARAKKPKDGGGSGSGKRKPKSGKWSCAFCTLINSQSREKCSACGASKPVIPNRSSSVSSPKPAAASPRRASAAVPPAAAAGDQKQPPVAAAAAAAAAVSSTAAVASGAGGASIGLDSVELSVLPSVFVPLSASVESQAVLTPAPTAAAPAPASSASVAPPVSASAADASSFADIRSADDPSRLEKDPN